MAVLHRPLSRSALTLAISSASLFALITILVVGVLAAEPANEHVQRTWARTDDPVKTGQVSRTWMWGEHAFSGPMQERYDDSPGGERMVQYFDKTRMEINDPNGDPSSPWYVTNGLLVVELVTGQVQIGDASFDAGVPATGNVAGDQDDPTSPTYQTMGTVVTAKALPDDATIIWRLDRAGNVTDDPSLAVYGVTAAEHVQVPGIDHQVASPFWTFMNSTGTVFENGSYITASLFPNPFYATGLPITEAYWANVKVAGTYQDVLLQCFERRCLTYTPGNDAGWQVEAGNVGQHYYTWRYGEPAGEPATSTPEVNPTASPSPTPGDGDPTPTATAEPTHDTALNYVHHRQIGGPIPPIDPLESPDALAIGADGFLYTIDLNLRILKFTLNGQVVDEISLGNTDYSSGGLAIAGDGAIFHGDVYEIDVFNPDGSLRRSWEAVNCAGAPAHLTDLTLDSSSNVYVAAPFEHQVYKFSSTGTLLDTWGRSNCAAGSSAGEFDGPDLIAVDSRGNLYVVDGGNSRVQVFDSSGAFVAEWTRGDDRFANVRALTIDDNNILYFLVGNAHPCGGCIMKYKSDGSFLERWTPTGDAADQLKHSSDIVVDDSGHLYVTSYQTNSIFKLDPDGNVAGKWFDFRHGRFGAATYGITLDSNDTLYVADDEFDRVQVFDSSGAYLYSFGEPGTGAGQIDGSIDVAVYGGYIYVLDRFGGRYQWFRPDGSFAGYTSGPFTGTRGFEIDDQGILYIADTEDHEIHRFTTTGGIVGVIGDEGQGNGELRNPHDVAVYGDRIYVADTNNHRIQVFNKDGDYIGQWGSRGSGAGQFDQPGDVAVDSDGYVYVADTLNHRIQKFTPDGEFLTMFGTAGSGPRRLYGPWKLTIASNGDVYILDQSNLRVQVFRPVN